MPFDFTMPTQVQFRRKLIKKNVYRDWCCRALCACKNDVANSADPILRFLFDGEWECFRIRWSQLDCAFRQDFRVSHYASRLFIEVKVNQTLRLFICFDSIQSEARAPSASDSKVKRRLTNIGEKQKWRATTNAKANGIDIFSRVFEN